jgi:branched-chain amino acid transport system ATP-binding protein/branched-chain amino acid transport system permease protein
MIATAWRLGRRVPSWAYPLLGAAVLLLLPTLRIGFSASLDLQDMCILALLVSGLNLSLGFAGELALGQAAMYAAGAYTAGLLSTAGETDILVQLLASAAVALGVGVAAGIPGLRLGRWSLAMTSFFLVLIVPDVLTIFTNQTGGPNGLSGMLGPTLFGAPLDSDGLYWVIAVVTVAWFILLRNFLVSRHGVALRVLKQSPVLAASTGISVFRAKLLAYALGALPAGLAGVLFANLNLYISPDAFGFVLATTVLAASILGGSASIYGALIGAVVLQFSTNQSTNFQEYALLFTGAFLIVGGLILRGGLAGIGSAAVARLDRYAAVPGSPVPTPESTLAERELSPRATDGALAVQNVSKTFGGNQALRNVSFLASAGSVTALIGPNGSGKTTMLNVICGFYRADGGQIILEGRELQGARSHQIARAGVVRTFQTPNIPEGVTVLEAVAAARFAVHRTSAVAAALRTRRFRRITREDTVWADKALTTVGLADVRLVRASSLPLGGRRLLEVARAVASEPRVLLLDEIASGLDEDEVVRLSEVIRTICRGGCIVVLVEHNFRLVQELAAKAVVLAHGEVIASGSPREIEQNERVLSEFLGVTANRSQARAPAAERAEGDSA